MKVVVTGDRILIDQLILNYDYEVFLLVKYQDLPTQQPNF